MQQINKKYIYITIKDLSDTIRQNIWKIPRDIDCIVGVPRSGSICACLIAAYLNMPYIDIDSYICGLNPSGGSRLRFNKKQNNKKVLVIDDTVYFGGAMRLVKQKIKFRQEKFPDEQIKYIYGCVYLDHDKGLQYVDFYLSDNRKIKEDTEILYEWNIFNHDQIYMRTFLYDMEGVLCLNSQFDMFSKEYENYIINSAPLFIPQAKIGGIITDRNIKYKDITLDWLHKYNISADNLILPNYNQNDYLDSNFKVNSIYFKANYYKNNNQYKLFIEANDNIAKEIVKISGKPVFSVEKNIIHNE